MRMLTATILLALTGAPANAEDGNPVVSVSQGELAGIEEQGVQVFKGIPYAAPPLGDLRWRPPAEAESWTGVRDAREFSADCIGDFPPDRPMAEDCLYLNVWTTGMAQDEPRAVMVWIYGGGYRGGSAAMPLFDGADLARRGTVFVSFNYRTGPLGFLALPELTRESPQGSSGNYGILDAIAALRWVQQNIAAFGGDPGNVTLFGQSSGSETVNILTASPLAKGLFQRAIGQSGSSFGVRAALPLASAEEVGVGFAQARGAHDLADLRGMPAGELLPLDDEKIEPNIDGWLLPQDVYTIYRQGKQNDVPMLIGSNAQEWARPTTITREMLLQDISRNYDQWGRRLETILGPIASDGQATDALWKLTNAEWGDFPAATWSSLQAASGSQPVYRYLFDYAPPTSENRTRIAHHGAELPYVFGTYKSKLGDAVTAIDDRVYDQISRYWVNFARHGNPNEPGLPEWQPLGKSPGEHLHISGQDTTQTPVRDEALIELLTQYTFGSRNADGD